jgi:hypothetical protein
MSAFHSLIFAALQQSCRNSTSLRSEPTLLTMLQALSRAAINIICAAIECDFANVSRRRVAPLTMSNIADRLESDRPSRMLSHQAPRGRYEGKAKPSGVGRDLFISISFCHSSSPIGGHERFGARTVAFYFLCARANNRRENRASACAKAARQSLLQALITYFITIAE